VGLVAHEAHRTQLAENRPTTNRKAAITRPEPVAGVGRLITKDLMLVPISTKKIVANSDTKRKPRRS